MRTLLDSLETGEFQMAIMTLDFSKTPEKGPYARLRDAQRLKAVLDRMAVVDYSKISDDPDGARFRFPPGEVSQPVVIEKLGSGYWKFSAQTVDRIDEMVRRKRVLYVHFRNVIGKMPSFSLSLAKSTGLCLLRSSPFFIINPCSITEQGFFVFCQVERQSRPNVTIPQ